MPSFASLLSGVKSFSLSQSSSEDEQPLYESVQVNPASAPPSGARHDASPATAVEEQEAHEPIAPKGDPIAAWPSRRR
jgi:hypothetical protein